MATLMKDSGIEWIGKIPEHWEIKRIKDVLISGKKSLIPSGEATADGEFDFYISGENKKKINVILSNKKALLFPTGGSYFVHYADKNYAYSTDVLPLREKKELHLHLKYLFYLFSFNQNYFNVMMFRGTGMKHFQRDFFMSTPICLPSIQEQKEIANFLDKKTGDIDSQIELLTKKTELLTSYKSALISKTVTKGLDKNVVLKDSGIEWIGEIPEHWEIKRLKDFFSLKSGKDISSENGTYKLFGANGVIGLTNNYSINKETILIGRVGSAGSLNLVNEKIGISDNVLKVCFKKNKTNLKYFYFLLSSMDFSRIISKNAQPLITATNVGSEFTVVAPIKEQEEIREFLDKETAKIDKKIELINKKIELLKDYKKALIFEAVTGKLEIPSGF